MPGQSSGVVGRYGQHFVMERRDGVLLLRMHTGGGPAVMSLALHNAWGQAFQEVGNDPDTELLIITGTGDSWMAGLEPGLRERRPYREWTSEARYATYYDGLKLLENLVFSVDVPTIGAINGSGFHHELALVCDLTLCTPATVFDDTHFPAGAVPGDGQHLVFQELMGLKRAAFSLYTGAGIDARQAAELGLVNEVVDADRLLPRAWELAETIMAAPRTTRRLTHAVLQRPWRRRLVDDLAFGRTHQLFDA
ncbi:enoyl-CoA hydratase/isomerase family protein [Nonomuraea sp. NEAU-A123]|uniref:enoyl-CoA hydratase/isomerase family protein n=1 Tax=Nonomuraea sp. NEAU-A123 TaxID=2839649 RepID=UPI001BE3D09A|nr:enoyl-CoA hydratase/isomerase family protein [Nonomuraea sp. NEAU-A123]MBT2226927.1 enoyl-CoA hydratase/isomerase family protein [Nonomuraea sp. NEAU-A123]